MANKRNLSLKRAVALRLMSAFLLCTTPSLLATGTEKAQVPPRSEAAQEQREEKSPLFTDEAALAKFALVQSSAHIRFSYEPLSIEFVADDGKQAKILFTESGVTYSGDVTLDESTKMFFDLFWKEYILEQHLRAKCEDKGKQ